VIIAVCTFRRNDLLRNLMRASLVAAAEARDRAAVGIIVVDDDPQAGARRVTLEFDGRFELGVHYRVSGRQNVSLARNLAIDDGAQLGDWVAMIDDDCEPTPRWLVAHLEAQELTGCDSTTGAMLLKAPPGAPAWLTDEPFYVDYIVAGKHLELVKATGTNNVMIRSAWLAAHPEIRFREDLGRSGGEDWVFFRTARKAGLDLRFSNDATVIGHESANRATWRYQIKNRFWLGNTEWRVGTIIKDRTHAGLLRRGVERLASSLVRLVRDLPRYHYSVANVARSVGFLAGAVGVRMPHH
jgi:succinoglycan biosynthesis protein ExoM